MGNNETGSGTSAYPNEPRFGNSDYPCNTPEPIHNLFHLRRDHLTASEYRAARVQAFADWAEVAGAPLAV